MSPNERIVKPFGCEFQSYSVRLKIKTSDLQSYKPPQMVHFARARGNIEFVFFVANQGVRQSEVYEELQRHVPTAPT